MIISQSLIKITAASQPLEKTTARIRSINLVIMIMMWNMLKSQKNQKL